MTAKEIEKVLIENGFTLTSNEDGWVIYNREDKVSVHIYNGIMTFTTKNCNLMVVINYSLDEIIYFAIKEERDFEGKFICVSIQSINKTIDSFYVR